MLFRGLATIGSTRLDARTSLAITVQSVIYYICMYIYVYIHMHDCMYVYM